eukprot:CAMPEP_0182521926 /NCGR_PEP_ID=MMETSP1321-20130603/46373_1 /TAXON_ID=91990 /ORGANISM="Bolidomonas sp., Strain RCC1657" /LENGTH=496 /DNA_ID=CAMNT_0024729963 /DNA_START=127 /DNA_END=1615 /DNA_ORIENTATION=+
MSYPSSSSSSPSNKKLKPTNPPSSLAPPSAPPAAPPSSSSITPHSIDSFVVSLPSSLRLHLSSYFTETEINRIQECYKKAPERTVFRQVPPPPAAPDFPSLPISESSVAPLPQIPSVYLTKKTTDSPPPLPSLLHRLLQPPNSPNDNSRQDIAEAVLRGAAIFNVGILSSNGDIVKGTEVYVWGDVTLPGGAGKTSSGKSKKNNRGCKVPLFQGDVMYLGVGVVEVEKQSDFFRLSKGTGVTMVSLATGKKPLSLNSLDNTKWFCQNLPSLVPAYSLSETITSDSTVLDMCAAPGGKTSHISSLSKNCFIVANDRSKKKMTSVSTLLKSQGFDNVNCISSDATKLCDSLPSSSTVPEIFSKSSPDTSGVHSAIKRLPPSSFTHILLDPPCSALGLRPRLHVPSNDDVQKYSVYQRGFVDQAVKLLKPGGVMCYSTCTYNPDENEGVVRHVLEKYEDMELVDVGVELGKEGVEWEGLTEEDRKKVRRFDWCDAEERE